MTSLHTLSENTLVWNFDVKHVNVILGHNVVYRDVLLQLPILMLQCSRGSQTKRVGFQRGLKFDLLEAFLS